MTPIPRYNIQSKHRHHQQINAGTIIAHFEFTATDIMQVLNLIVLLLFTLCEAVLAANGPEWRSRTIYQVVTDRFALTNGSTTTACDTGLGLYCGGTWAGITQRLDYIQDMGFDAVWISPVTKQLDGNSIDGTSYHGYWQTNINEVNSAFGSEDDLRNLAAALHSRGMVSQAHVVQYVSRSFANRSRDSST